MTVNKRFAQDGTALDDCMDQLLEVLAQLLEEPQNQAAAGGAAQPGSDLPSGDDRVIHVVVHNQKK